MCSFMRDGGESIKIMIELLVRTGVRLRVRVRVKVRVWARFRVRVTAFFDKKLRILSRGKMTSCHSGGWK